MSNHGDADQAKAEMSESLDFLRTWLARRDEVLPPIGAQAEAWLRQAEHIRQDLADLLDPRSLATEVQVRSGVPELIRELATSVRASSDPNEPGE